ncbi:hypothetical protein F511_12041 [Dorcoceras hygrometricum]|uniref:Uncharacterized protein n=1 Tax=Dorcoceras hygrometricum TaxID=472368 RepID=A0A2Z7BXQ9_9LAMI|nr:hypothetical protein F511_12041 [Dorcoceras hygrometricum]
MTNLRIVAAVCFALLLASLEFGECVYIGYPALGADGIPKQTAPPVPVNHYNRGCTEKERCRGSERRLLRIQPKAPSAQI